MEPEFYNDLQTAGELHVHRAALPRPSGARSPRRNLPRRIRNPGFPQQLLAGLLLAKQRSHEPRSADSSGQEFSPRDLLQRTHLFSLLELPSLQEVSYHLDSHFVLKGALDRFEHLERFSVFDGQGHALLENCVFSNGEILSY